MTGRAAEKCVIFVINFLFSMRQLRLAVELEYNDRVAFILKFIENQIFFVICKFKLIITLI